MKKHWKELSYLCCWAVLLLAACTLQTPSPTSIPFYPAVNIVMEPNTSEVTPGQEVVLSVNASGEELTITWYAPRGTFSSNYGSSIIYTAPDTPGPVTIVVQVSNMKGTRTDAITLDVVQVPTPTGTFTPTSTVTSTSAPILFSFTHISDVKMGESARVSGNYNLPLDAHVWIFLEDNFLGYFLQSPPDFYSNGRWEAIIYMGRGMEVSDIVAVSVDIVGDIEIQSWYDRGDFGAMTEDDIKNLSGYSELARAQIIVGSEVEIETPRPEYSTKQTETAKASTAHVTINNTAVIKLGGLWRAIVTVDVHDGNHVPLSGAIVQSNWGRCTTGESGICDISVESRNSTNEVTIMMLDVDYKNYYYNPSDNHPGELTVTRTSTPSNTPSVVTPPSVTVAIGDTNSPTPTILFTPNATQTIQAAYAVVEEDIHQANITFNKPPEQMEIESSETIELILSPSESQQILVTQIVERMELATSTAEPGVLIGESGGIITIESSRIDITPRMKALLKSKDPEAFVITELDEGAEQVILQNDTTTWRWSIVAKKEGPQTLELTLYRLIKYDDQEFWHDVETYKADIEVQVTQAEKAEEKSETTKEWLSIIATLVAIIVSILAIWKWFEDRRKKDKDNVLQVKIVEEKKNKGKTIMNGKLATETIKRKLAEKGGQVRIPLQRGRYFKATLTDDGILVDNLGSQPMLEWVVFEEAVELLVRKGGRADRGDAMGYRLGDEGLSLDSIEGHVAHVVYGKKAGDSVFRRISPIAAILVWTGICDASKGELILH